ncbi:hypothetical protein AA0Y32_02185 [Georgenia phoenicis]|uniref:hypothetical protein n=1 Tax=unclassified Georgenia TaxID=2626815 RepID=UPI0039AEC9C2
MIKVPAGATSPHEQIITCEEVFELAEDYGDVHRLSGHITAEALQAALECDAGTLQDLAEDIEANSADG